MIKNEANTYVLDQVYKPQVSQECIYQNSGYEIIEDVLKGINGTIFAYGATGSGKTFTMFGEGDMDESDSSQSMSESFSQTVKGFF